MEEIAWVVFLGELTLISLLGFLGYKILQDRRRLHKPMIKKFFGAAVLIIVWALLVLHQPLHLWQRILATFSAQYGVLLYYCALDQMLNDKKVRPVLRSRLFPITTLVVLTVVLLDFRLGNYQLTFGCTGQFTPKWVPYTEAALNYFGLLYLDVLIVWVYAKDLRQHADLIYTARRSLCMLGFAINLLGLLLLEGSLLLSFLVGGRCDFVATSIYVLSLIPMAALVAGGYLLPDRFFSTALRPVSAYVTLCRRQEQELLSYLHWMMIQIVPGVQLDCEQIHHLRIPIEISDARQVIWSQELRTQSITPEEEARHLLRLIRTHTVFEKPGEFLPAPTHEGNIGKHNLAVARQLKRLQAIGGE